MENCCDMMYNWFVDATKPLETNGHPLIKYIPKGREHVFILNYGYVQLFYCPWCGVKLPEDLSEKWCEVIKEELGIDDEDLDAQGYAKLPEEFKTDQWWKKRGLG
jgi:hypothetical protein